MLTCTSHSQHLRFQCVWICELICLHYVRVFSLSLFIFDFFFLSFYQGTGRKRWGEKHHFNHYHLQINAHIQFTLIAYQTSVRMGMSGARERRQSSKQTIQSNENVCTVYTSKLLELWRAWLLCSNVFAQKKQKTTERKSILNGKYFSNINWIVICARSWKMLAVVVRSGLGG